MLPKGDITPENQCKFEGETLKVSVTAGGLSENNRAGVGQLFERTTGATIEWVEQGSDAMFTILLAGGEPPVDIVLDMYVPTLYEAAEAGVFQSIDWSSIPNLSDVPADAYPVDGLGPGVYFWAVGTCYSLDVLGELGVDVPTSFADLSDPAYGSVGFPQPTNSRWNLTMAALAADMGVSMDDPEPVIDMLAGFGDRLVLYAGTADADQLVQTGETSTIISSDGRCNGMARSGAPVEFGSLGLEVDGESYDVMPAMTGPQIVTGSDKIDLAKTFVNTLFTLESLRPLTTSLIYTPTEPAIRTAVESDPEVGQYLKTDLVPLHGPYMQEFMQNRELWIDAWNRTFQ